MDSRSSFALGHRKCRAAESVGSGERYGGQGQKKEAPKRLLSFRQMAYQPLHEPGRYLSSVDEVPSVAELPQRH